MRKTKLVTKIKIYLQAQKYQINACLVWTSFFKRTNRQSTGLFG